MTALALVACTWILVLCGFVVGWVLRARLDYTDLEDEGRRRR